MSDDLGADVDKILEAYSRLGSARAVDREFPDMSYFDVLKVLKDNGVELRRGRPIGRKSGKKLKRRRRPSVDPAELSDVIDELSKEYKTVNDIFSVLSAEGHVVNKPKLSAYLKEQGFDVKKGRKGGTTRIPERDALIAQGLALEDIAGQVGVTREAIRQYINNSGQYDFWRERREVCLSEEYLAKCAKSCPKDDIVRGLASQIVTVALQGAAKEGQAQVWALQYSLGGRKDRLDYDRVLPLFELYEKGLSSDTSPSLQELADAAGLGFASCALKILNAVGLSAFNELKRLPDELRWAIVRGLDVEYFSMSDIAFFVGCNPYNIIKSYKDADRKRPDVLAIPARGGRGIFAYHQASMIFESLDEGYDVNETADIVGKPVEVVQHVIDNPADLEKKLIDGLCYMFSDDSIDRPYLEK